jgi:Flavodoxin reductases (ferredoxin-NADPH reductases) family 1
MAPQDETGLLDLDALLGTPQPDTLVYCCGPEPLLAAVEALRGLAGQVLHVERFAARPLTAPVRAEAFEVELAASELTLTIPPDRSILDVVERPGSGCCRPAPRAPAAPARRPCSAACLTIATRC